MAKLLRIDQLKVRGLPPLTFEVRAGDCLAVEGPSGSGKSLLLRAIADLDPAKGHVFLDGTEKHDMPGPDWRRLVRYIAAEPGWWSDKAATHFSDTARAADNIAALGLEPSHLDQQIASLSTGERQRIALIRALADDPEVVLFDEPTSSLDSDSAALVEDLVRSQIQAGKCVVLVSHDKALIGRLASARLQLCDKSPASVGAETAS